MCKAIHMCSCMRSLREPLLEAELNRDRKSSLWLFATEIMVRVFLSFLSMGKQSNGWCFNMILFITTGKFTLHHYRSHYLHSKSLCQSSCSSALWRKAPRQTTVSPRSQELVWLIYCLSSSSPSTAFPQYSGEILKMIMHIHHNSVHLYCHKTNNFYITLHLPFPAVAVLYLFFSATWNTSINYSLGMLSIQYEQNIVLLLKWFEFLV